MSMESVQRRYDQENYDYSGSVEENSDFSENEGADSASEADLGEDEGEVSGRYRGVERGRVEESDVSDADRLKHLDEAAGSGGEDLTTALVDLKKEIKAADIPQKLKQDYVEKVEALLKKAMKNQLEDSSEVEDLKSEFQSVLEENPSFAKRLVDYVKTQNASVEGLTEEKVKEAMKKYHFTEESLSKMVLPGDELFAQRLLDFLKEVNPDLAQTLTSDPEKGFSAKSLTDLQGMINVVYPQGVNTDMVVKLVDQTEKSTWNIENIKSKFTGNLKYEDGSRANNRWYSVTEFADALDRLSKGGSFGDESIEIYLNRGRNSADEGPKHKGVEIRRFLSGLWESANKNPYLFRHHLKQLPENALLAMKDLLDYRGGGGCDGGTKEMGDRFDTTQSSNILQWAVNGGPVPAELQSETSRDMNSQISQSQVEQ